VLLGADKKGIISFSFHFWDLCLPYHRHTWWLYLVSHAVFEGRIGKGLNKRTVEAGTCSVVRLAKVKD